MTGEGPAQHPRKHPQPERAPGAGEAPPKARDVVRRDTHPRK